MVTRPSFLEQRRQSARSPGVKRHSRDHRHQWAVRAFDRAVEVRYRTGSGIGRHACRADEFFHGDFKPKCVKRVDVIGLDQQSVRGGGDDRLSSPRPGAQ